MNDISRDRTRKLMMLGGIGLGLAMLGRKRRWRRYAVSQMMGGGYAGGPWGRFGGYGHGVPGGPPQAVTLPPFIEATLKALARPGAWNGATGRAGSTGNRAGLISHPPDRGGAPGSASSFRITASPRIVPIVQGMRM